MATGTGPPEPHHMHVGQKRRRTERSFVRDMDLWMEDGNIVIAATDVDDADESGPAKEETTYVFKCHRSILSMQSKVFEGLLGIPPSVETRDMYDGFPLVILPDAYADVKALLSYLYKPGEIPHAGTYLWETEDTCGVLDELQGPFRLAAKYEFTDLHSSIAKTLEFMWPTSLDQWDTRRDWEYRNYQSWRAEHTPWAGHAVNLGYEARLLSIVPCAFYFLNSRLPELSWSLKWGRFEGEGPEQDVQTSMHSLLDGLTLSQVSQLMAGREIINGVTRSLLLSLLPNATLYCVDCIEAPMDSEELRRKRKYEGKTPCAPGIARWWREKTPRIAGSGQEATSIVFSDPLGTLAELSKAFETSMKHPRYKDLKSEGICDCCQTGVTSALEKLRQYIWDELPYFFSVKPRDPGTVYGYQHYIEELFTLVT